MDDIDNPFASEAITPPLNDEWQAKRRIADAIRLLSETLVTSSPDIDEMHALAEQLEATAQRFGDSPRLFGRLAWLESGQHGSFGQISGELNSLGGLSNPLAPPVRVWMDNERAYGSCRCGWRYEGPPGSVHGGYVAAIFDQFLGVAQILGGQPGMTGYLHVNYHQRTPLNTDLRLAGEVVSVSGRKTLARGELFAGDTLTASCEALFIAPKQGIYALRNPDAGGG